MPNYVTNIILIHAPEERRNGILRAIQNDAIGLGSIDFNKVIPMPQNLNNESDRSLSDGVPDWYSWSNENWGTKWNALVPEAPVDKSAIHFLSAWSPPVPVLQKLSEQYPDVRWEHRWADEDLGYNVGEAVYCGGKQVRSHIPEEGSREAYEMAFEIQETSAEESGLRYSAEEGTYISWCQQDQETALTLA